MVMNTSASLVLKSIPVTLSIQDWLKPMSDKLLQPLFKEPISHMGIVDYSLCSLRYDPVAPSSFCKSLCKSGQCKLAALKVNKKVVQPFCSIRASNSSISDTNTGSCFGHIALQPIHYLVRTH